MREAYGWDQRGGGGRNIADMGVGREGAYRLSEKGRGVGSLIEEK